MRVGHQCWYQFNSHTEQIGPSKVSPRSPKTFGVRVLGFGFWVWGFGVWGLGFGAGGLGFGVWIRGLTFRLEGGYRVSGLGLRA